MSSKETDFNQKLMSQPMGLDHIRVCHFDELAAAVFHDQVVRRHIMDPSGPIVVYIDSFGGSADALASMLETIESVPNKIITVCVGKAMSCGAILLAAGDDRYCGKHSRVMIHEIKAGGFGDASDLRTMADEITRLDIYWMDFFAKRCGMKNYLEFKGVIDNADGNDIYLDAQGAKDFGVVDEVGLPFVRPMVMFNVDAGPHREFKTVDKTPIKETPIVKKKAVRKASKKATKKVTKKVVKKTNDSK